MKISKGFTLIEIIITLTVMAIAATMALTYTGGTSFTQSAVPAGQVSSQYKLIQQMEVITNSYRQALEAGGGTIADLCAFKLASVDGKEFVDTTPANTRCDFPMSDISGAYTTTQIVLLVTLTDGQQKLQSIFTK